LNIGSEEKRGNKGKKWEKEVIGLWLGDQ